MSIYNMIGGRHPCAGLCLLLLKLDPGQVPRLRDAWPADDGTKVTVLTRTGGGNREQYTAENEWMRQRPGYLFDDDDEFDSTYAHFHYAVPEKYQADLAIMGTASAAAGKGAETNGPRAVLNRFTEALNNKGKPPPKPLMSSDDPRIEAACQAYERILNDLLPPEEQGTKDA